MPAASAPVRAEGENAPVSGAFFVLLAVFSSACAGAFRETSPDCGGALCRLCGTWGDCLRFLPFAELAGCFCFRSSGLGGRGAFSAAAPCRKRGNRAACRIFLPRKVRKQALPEFFASRPARFRQECGRDVVCAGARRTRGVRRSASPPCGRRRPFLRDFFLCLTFPRKTAARSAVRPFSCRGGEAGRAGFRP